MKFKEYVENLSELLKDNPELGDLLTVYSSDDEGNNYQILGTSPSIGSFEGAYQGEFIHEEDFEEEDIEGPNAICVN